MKRYDLAIIGSGPGGYVAAIYASRIGLSVLLIEKDKIGGTCLNRGCIPTKSLIHSASFISTIASAKTSGISVEKVSVDLSVMIAKKEEIVSRLRGGVEFLLKNRKIDVIKARARFVSQGSIAIDGHGAVDAAHIIIAAGSSVSGLGNITPDGNYILTSDDILNITAVPKSIVIIGGGVVGCEFASLFNTLGSKVTIVEITDRLIPQQSREVSKKLESSFRRKGIDVIFSASVKEVIPGRSVALTNSTILNPEMVLLSVGRKAAVEGLGLELGGILFENGRIKVDANLRTSCGNVFAIGDCISGPQLAHKASYDGMLACDNIAGKARVADYSLIPSCIWTDPQIAAVGLTEDAAKAKFPDCRIVKFPYTASGKALIEGATEGFVKLAGSAEGQILGVEIFGECACELIAEAATAMSGGMAIEKWAEVVHPHPTISEVLSESAHQFIGKGIHAL